MNKKFRSKKKATHVVPIDLSGNKGETLFWDVYVYAETLKKSIGDAQKEFELIRSEFVVIKDDRSRAIVAAMIIEQKIDQLLSTYIPSYKKLESIKEFSFSFKIEMALSLKILPSKILNSIDPLRKIRNKFAHQLSIKSFEQYVKLQNKEKIKDFNNVLNKIKTFGKFHDSGPKENHELLTTSICYALLFYTEQLKVYSKVIREQKFVDDLFDNSKTLSEGNTSENMDPVPVKEIKPTPK